MDQTNRTPDRIDDENRAAIRYVDPEGDSWVVSHERITIIEAAGHRCLFDHSDARAMHLLRSNQRPLSQSVIPKNSLVNTIKATKGFLLVVGHFQTWHSQGKTMSHSRQRIERRKLFSSELTRLHFP